MTVFTGLELGVLLAGWAAQLMLFGWWARGRESDLRRLIDAVASDISAHKAECILVRQHQAEQAQAMMGVLKEGFAAAAAGRDEIRREQKEQRLYLQQWIDEEHKEHAAIHSKLDRVLHGRPGGHA